MIHLSFVSLQSKDMKRMLEGIQRLRWPNFTQFWPPTHPEPLPALLLPHPHLKYCHVPHFYQHDKWVSLQINISERKFNFLETSSCPRSYWMFVHFLRLCFLAFLNSRLQKITIFFCNVFPLFKYSTVQCFVVDMAQRQSL